MTDEPPPTRRRRAIPRGNSKPPTDARLETRVRWTAILLSLGLLALTAWLVWTHIQAGS